MPNPSDSEVLYFSAPEQLDTYFREGREHFNETYVKKLAQTGTYMKRVAMKMWPSNSGTVQRGFRFGRGYFNPDKPWYKIVSERCEANGCDSQPEKIKRPGTDSYTWQLLKKEMETDWICVEDLMRRLVPEHEVMQIENTNAIITRTVHEEFTKSNWFGASGHKWLGTVDEDSEFCGETTDSGWTVEEFEETGEGGYNLKYLRVNIDPADLNTIAELSVDMLDDCLLDLAAEEESYRIDFMEAGARVLDVVIPDSRIARRMWRNAREVGGFNPSEAGYDKNLSEAKLGVRKVIGDYALTYDSTAPKFNADSVFNATLGAYDAADPDTYPRLVRVPRYTEVEAEIGYKYIPNPEHKTADFGLTCVWVPDAMVKYTDPAFTGYGSVRMETIDYAGNFKWRRPDWESNRKGKLGFFEAEFHLAAQILDPTIMHSILHRVPNGKTLSTVDCPLIADYVDPGVLDNYVCQGAA